MTPNRATSISIGGIVARGRCGDLKKSRVVPKGPSLASSAALGLCREAEHAKWTMTHFSKQCAPDSCQTYHHLSFILLGFLVAHQAASRAVLAARSGFATSSSIRSPCVSFVCSQRQPLEGFGLWQAPLSPHRPCSNNNKSDRFSMSVPICLE